MIDEERIPVQHLEHENPVLIGVAFNEIMSKWEAIVAVGNFDSESEATDAARKMSQVLSEELGFSMELRSDPVRN